MRKALYLLFFGLLSARLASVAQVQHLGIGTTSSTQTLDVNKGLWVRAAGSGDGRLLSVAAAGTLQAQSAPYAATVTTTPQPPASLGTVPTGALPTAAAMNQAGTRAYVVNIGANTLQTFSIAAPPRLVAVSPNGSLGSVDPATLGDNLGNHAGTQNLDLGANQLVGQGGSQGLRISSAGSVGLGTAAPATRLDVNGNLRLALCTCPVNISAAHTLTAQDVAYSIFQLQNGAYSSPLTLPGASAGQVEGQELAVPNVAGATVNVSGANTDNSNSTVTLPGSGRLAPTPPATCGRYLPAAVAQCRTLATRCRCSSGLPVPPTSPSRVPLAIGPPRP